MESGRLKFTVNRTNNTVNEMKTTLLLEDDLYSQLVREAKDRHGSIRKLSQTVNDILRGHFLRKKDFFGITKEPFDYSDYRDKKDRFDHVRL